MPPGFQGKRRRRRHGGSWGWGRRRRNNLHIPPVLSRILAKALSLACNNFFHALKDSGSPGMYHDDIFKERIRSAVLG